MNEIKIGLRKTGPDPRYLVIRPDAVDVSRVDIVDIALGLGRQPRFAGQTPDPYSVAAHSVALAEWVYSVTGRPFPALLALLHDAPEALGVSDINRFVKLEYAAAICNLEQRIEDALVKKFVRHGFDAVGLAGEWRIVKAYDGRLGAAESRFFGWPVDDGGHPAPPPWVLNSDTLFPDDPADDFLRSWSRFTELNGGGK